MTLTCFTARSNLVTCFSKGKSENSGLFRNCDLKVGRCRQLIEFMKVCEYWRSRSFLYHIFSRFCMFCALLGQDIRWAFTGPLVLWFLYGNGTVKVFLSVTSDRRVQCSRVGLEVKIYDTLAGGIRAGQGTFSSVLWSMVSFIVIWTYRNDPTFLDRYVWASSADPDQSSLIRVFTVCYSICII